MIRSLLYILKFILLYVIIFVSKYEELHELTRREKSDHEEDSNVQHEVVTKDVEYQFNYFIPCLGKSLVYSHVLILFY